MEGRSNDIINNNKKILCRKNYKNLIVHATKKKKKISFNFKRMRILHEINNGLFRKLI